jgi:DNA polymerase III alpha subunit
MVKYSGKKTLAQMCRKGAEKLGIDLDDDGEYSKRYQYEMDLIHEKDYQDYFLITAEMIQDAKKDMLVGPARGSAAGSLVCYLADITTVDPIKHGLLFERFIDVNRSDLPDIDVDFPDEKRAGVIKKLVKKFKQENVCKIASVSKLKAKSAINEIAMSLSIPKWEVDSVKNSIVDRSGGDARAAMAGYDTLTQTDIGREFLEKFPAMKQIEKLEAHSTHSGTHAAGIIVCNEEISNFGGTNSRDGTIMMDKKGAEAKNLLKIDCLGLRTLSVLEECADQIGMPYSEFPNLPLDDEKTYDIFNDMRLSGIFQFEGQAMTMLCDNMGAHNFNDIVALTALARPGPLHSGAASTYIKRRIGEEEITFVCNDETYMDHVSDTQGVIIYQEQLMKICRDMGRMSWEEVSAIRTATSKTLGKDFFDKYRASFLRGAKENEIEAQSATDTFHIGVHI